MKVKVRMVKYWVTLMLWPALCLGSDWKENQLTRDNFLRMKFETPRTSFAMLVQDTATALQVTVRGDNWHRSKQCFFGVGHRNEWISLDVKRGGSIEESSFGREDWSLSCSHLVAPETTTVLYLSSGGPGSIRVKTNDSTLLQGSALVYLPPFKRLNLNTSEGWRVTTRLDNPEIAITLAVVAEDWTRIKQCNFDEEETRNWQTMEMMKRGHELDDSSFGKLGWARRCFRLDLPESSTAMFLFNGGPGKISFKAEKISKQRKAAAGNITMDPPTPTDTPQTATVALMALLVACCICLLALILVAFVCWRYKKKRQQVASVEAGRNQSTQPTTRNYQTSYPHLEMNQQSVRFTNNHEGTTIQRTNEPRTATTPASCNNTTNSLKGEPSCRQDCGQEETQASSEHIYEEWDHLYRQPLH